MLTRLAVPVAVALLVAGCGDSRSAGPHATTTTVAQEMTVAAYFLRDGRIALAHVQVPRTRAVADAALRALFAGPPAGLETALPGHIEGVHVTVAGGTADVSIRPGLELSAAGSAQIVYTLTQFPTVERVRLEGAAPATRADFEDETPIILVESPAPGETVRSPLHVTGTANTFEATLQLRLVQNGAKLYEHFVTATSGSGQRGTFTWEIPFEAHGPATLEAFEYSAADGSEIHKVRIPVELG